MDFLNKLREVAEKIAEGEKIGTNPPGSTEAFFINSKDNISNICNAMAQEVFTTQDLLHYTCFDRNGVPRDISYEDMLDLMGQHRRIYLDTVARITIEMDTLNDRVSDLCGFTLFDRVTAVEAADLMIAELGDMTKREMFQYAMAASGKTDKMDDAFVFTRDIRMMSASALDAIITNSSVSTQKTLREYMLTNKAPETTTGSWGQKKNDMDFSAIQRLEELYHAVSRIRDHADTLSDRIGKQIHSIIEAVGLETWQAGSMFLDTVDAVLSEKDGSEEKLGKLMTEQFDLKVETDDKITKAVMDLQNGALNKLDIDLLEGTDPVAWAEDLIYELRVYGRSIERAQTLAAETGGIVQLPQGLPFFKEMLESSNALIKQLKADRSVSLRDAVFGGARKIPQHSIVVRKAPETIYSNALQNNRNNGAKVLTCFIPILCEPSKRIKNVPVPAYYVDKDDAYYIRESDYLEVIKNGTPAVPVVIEPSPFIPPSDFSKLARQSFFKAIFNYDSKMPESDRHSIIDGAVNNKTIADVDASLSFPVSDRDTLANRAAFGVTGAELMHDAIRRIMQVQDPIGYVSRYITGMKAIHGKVYLNDQIFFAKKLYEAKKTPNVLRADIVL